ncbi:hypothetical protein [Nakamurella sp. PAMC28650]|uniref:hypothetical protein n=1 Tax=Nakamurella sp. PAMC28650 TaxID=2762325 RepID=UPI00164D5E31|nr:hypothetical protein [Nakamurella sp. PAMC28650]QNK80125.1 hypothetical protein H7F38_18165 [Nakamurella sp. PAMC28650]
MLAASFFTDVQAAFTSGRRPVGGSSEYCRSTGQAGPFVGPATSTSALAWIGPGAAAVPDLVAVVVAATRVVAAGEGLLLPPPRPEDVLLEPGLVCTIALVRAIAPVVVVTLVGVVTAARAVVDTVGRSVPVSATPATDPAPEQPEKVSSVIPASSAAAPRSAVARSLNV